ncbi:3-methyl-2-oxobutanoate hydroxymethyltransferase [Streptomyces sp. WM6373]|uniref:isocitrate lyase/PEP mutase family protein n=2 Tax=Streptomyces TaxID=1883 RepID=UPI00069E73A4|nr:MULTISPECIES: isocitrate lyase/phosphoenolpyruvate mutase family protein [unclassified Streptomyces]KOU27623.1 3-methyl-2-oxobutanoate hydroxymethyltransferase [Streptomyces sp. WM6373]KOU64833.1 3-methyl-2-oxobutanoate hydroxymethyltransferase [Streptomyces sp. IGB124]KOU68675.1 3-methyl-2-oxobutanoate hydroxymethyltransferase [Streptomyces sp. XY66]KOU78391.1 3-methyl-2-oxobutanoate hydroxymethyltransferase [Streptomyces sp. XY58]KOV08338.1 3-methyl-2-oxobutanoate hydroxymethyltransferase
MSTHTRTPIGLAAKATAFTALHTPTAPLALANAWDVASARIVEATGAPAVATTSAGVAWSLGSPDGDALARDRALDLIARVTAAVSVPVTADIEGGFGTDPAAVGETVAGVIAAGAVGINIEDGTRDPAEQAERLAAARAAADSAGVPLYVNARVDTYLKGLGEPAARLDETLARAASYLRAGASGVFVPGVLDPATVAELAKGIDAPLNILLGPDAPTVAACGALGVSRVSLGSWVAEAAYAVVRRAAEELATGGTYGALAHSLPYGELNDLLKG